jgi:hypothetical protein
MVFGGLGEQESEIEELKRNGWQLLGGGGMPYADPKRVFNDSQWESYERIFGY